MPRKSASPPKAIRLQKTLKQSLRRCVYRRWEAEVKGTVLITKTTDLLGMLGQPERTFYLDNENEAAKEPKDLDGVPLRIFDFPLPSLG